jgi:hypothetical protein
MQVHQKIVFNSDKDKDKNKDNDNNNNPLFDRKVDLITAGLAAGWKQTIHSQ